MPCCGVADRLRFLMLNSMDLLSSASVCRFEERRLFIFVQTQHRCIQETAYDRLGPRRNKKGRGVQEIFKAKVGSAIVKIKNFRFSQS